MSGIGEGKKLIWSIFSAHSFRQLMQKFEKELAIPIEHLYKSQSSRYKAPISTAESLNREKESGTLA
jgi:hypothetical protein